MAFTSTDLENIESAIVELATGQRVVSLTIAGKTYQFAASNLDRLQQLRATIQAELAEVPVRTYAANGGRGAWVDSSS